MKILITGGAGYIGSMLATALAPAHKVTVLDTFVSGTCFVNHLIDDENVEFVLGDIRDNELMRHAVVSADAIIHLAGIVGFPACDANPFDTQTVNVDATLSLAKLVSANQRLIFSSTGSVYGKITEGVCTESTPTNPTSLYGISSWKGRRPLWMQAAFPLGWLHCSVLVTRCATIS